MKLKEKQEGDILSEGTKKLFPNDYELFRSTMIEAAESNQLPVLLSLEHDKGFSLNDFKEMFMEFRRDTGLQISATLYLCDLCDKLHVVIEIDYPEPLENGLVQ